MSAQLFPAALLASLLGGFVLSSLVLTTHRAVSRAATG